MDLRRLVQRGPPEEQLLRLTAEIRDCRIRVLRAKQNKNPQRPAEERAALLKIEDQIAAWLELSPERVLAEYRGHQ